MVRTMGGRARPFSVISALVLVVMTIGIGGMASADPGSGNARGADGNDVSATARSVNGEGESHASEATAAAPGLVADEVDSTTDPTTDTTAPGASVAASAHSQGAEVASAAPVNGKALGRADGSSTTDQQGSSDHSTGVGSNGTSGDYDQPQPPSRADTNPGGANGQCPEGPYCSTRDGSPSANGNGNGQATGKPCAGCVGRADNKNPHGQYPNGSDHNAGYECDRNHGVGRGNPAHTGCEQTPPPPSTCEDRGDCPPPPSTCEDRGDCPKPPSTCEDRGDCPKPPSTCEQRGDCPPPPSTCEQRGDCPKPPSTCEQRGDCPKPPHHGCKGSDCITPPGEQGPPEVTVRPRPPEILGVQGVRDHRPPAAAPGVAAPTGASVLPSTGAPAGLEGYALAGLALAAAGGATLAARRQQARR
jgi:LPXTG-motif cell wall-anchored protein